MLNHLKNRRRCYATGVYSMRQPHSHPLPQLRLWLNYSCRSLVTPHCSLETSHRSYEMSHSSSGTATTRHLEMLQRRWDRLSHCLVAQALWWLQSCASDWELEIQKKGIMCKPTTQNNIGYVCAYYNWLWLYLIMFKNYFVMNENQCLCSSPKECTTY